MNRNDLVFWRTDGNDRLELNPVDFLVFLENHGFYKVVFPDLSFIIVQVNNNVVSEMKPHLIKGFVKSHLLSIHKSDVLRKLLSSRYLTHSFLESLDAIDVNLILGSSIEGLLFFRNGFLKITPDGYNLCDYSTLNGYVWNTQIINRDFNESSLGESEFSQFVFNLAGRHQERFSSIKSIIGYLSHNYKDRSNSPAVILLDEKMAEGEANGGTGKSLLCRAFSKITNVVTIEGKNLNQTRFFFQQVNHDTRILYYDDLMMGFNFKSLFPALTGDVSIEKKYKNAFTIAFKDFPKILLSSNYPVIKGIGYSFNRRKIEFEISDYYGPDRTPASEFGHLLFDDWTEEEWNKFDLFMVGCIQFYLKEGLIEPEPINLIENTLVVMTSSAFTDYADSSIESNTEYNKSDLRAEFLENVEDEDFISQRKFNRFLKVWAEIRCKNFIERESNGEYLIKFIE